MRGFQKGHKFGGVKGEVSNYHEGLHIIAKCLHSKRYTIIEICNSIGISKNSFRKFMATPYKHLTLSQLMTIAIMIDKPINEVLTMVLPQSMRVKWKREKNEKLTPIEREAGKKKYNWFLD